MMKAIYPTVAQSLKARHDSSPNPAIGGGAERRLILALDGDKWKPRKEYRTRQGGNGFGINYENVCYTLNTVDRHIVAILGE